MQLLEDEGGTCPIACDATANDNKLTKPQRTLNQPHMLANVSVGCAADGITKLPVYTVG